jgi:hypothetical protein
MTQNLNQTRPTSEKGMLDLGVNWNLFDCRIDPASVADFTSANAFAFKIVDVAGKSIMVDLATANSDDIFGFAPYEVRKNTYEKGDFIRLASKSTVMKMEASAAIARGAKVEIVPTGSKVATQSSGNVIGRALDKAAADGDLIRVLISVE